jgi:hypothetical protein
VGEAPPWVGQTSGEEEDAGIGERGLVLLLDLGFHRLSKREVTQTSKIAASVYWSRSCLAPFVIDLTRKAVGD